MNERRSLVRGLLIALLATRTLSAQEQTAIIAPERPAVGGQVVLTYNAGSRAAALRDVKEMNAEVLLMRESALPLCVEVPMKRSGTRWRGSFQLSDQSTKVFLVRFVSGERKDDNGENVWYALIYGADGNPVRGAAVQLGSVMRSGGFFDFRLKGDAETVRSLFEKEKELYPDNPMPYMLVWNSWMRENRYEEVIGKVKEELDRLYDIHKDDESTAANLLSWFDQTGQRERADQIRETAIRVNPRGKIAQGSRLNAVFAERDFAKRAALLEQFLEDFPDQGENLNNFKGQIASLYARQKNYDKAIAVLESMAAPDAMMYNNIAWGMIEGGEDVERGVALARKGIDLLRDDRPESKPPFMSARQWRENRRSGLGMVLDTYAFGLFKLNRLDEAERAYEEAYAASKGAEPDINERVVECYVKNGKHEKAVRIAEECIKRGKENEKLMGHYRAAYVALKGSDQGFDESAAALRKLARKELREKILKDLVNRPAIDFALKSLDGSTVRLSDLKGKVVVLDFWATWCGPCLSSFPYLQKVYEKYRSNPNVAIFAVNTWENLKGAEREEHVKKFIAQNKYTFPVLFDENFVEKYGVQGIPTKFMIDRKGMIQFKDIGFGGGQEMMDKLDLQFEILLSDEFYSTK